MNKFQDVRQHLHQHQYHWMVTDAAGLIGSHLVEALLGLGQRVTGLDNFATGHQRNVDQAREVVGLPAWCNFSFVEDDICEPGTCATLDRDESTNQVYNVALNERYVMPRELLAERFPHVAAHCPGHVNFHAGGVRRSQADISKAASLPGYTPRLAHPHGLERALDWYAGHLEQV